jgi:hypothetical protein
MLSVSGKIESIFERLKNDRVLAKYVDCAKLIPFIKGISSISRTMPPYIFPIPKAPQKASKHFKRHHHPTGSPIWSDLSLGISWRTHQSSSPDKLGD